MEESEGSNIGTAVSIDHQKRVADRRNMILVAVVGGLIGIIGTLLGSLVQIYGTAQTIDEAKSKEDRDHRADAYTTFMAATEKASNALVLLKTCVEGEPSPTLSSGILVLRESCADQAIDYAPTWQAMVEAAAKVSIYGSQEAVDLSKSLADALPKAPTTDTGRHGPGKYIPLDGYSKDFNFDSENYHSAYISLLKLTCRELVNNPRSACY